MSRPELWGVVALVVIAVVLAGCSALRKGTSSTPADLLQKGMDARWSALPSEAEEPFRAYLHATAELPVEGEHAVSLQSIAGFFEEVDAALAVDLYRRLIEAAEARSDPNANGYREILADLQCELGEVDEAVAHYRASIASQHEILGPAHPTIADSHRDLSRCLLRSGRVAEGFAELETMVQIRIEVHGETSAIAPALVEVARARAAHGDIDGASADLDRAIRLIDEGLETEIPIRAEMLQALRAQLVEERAALSP